MDGSSSTYKRSHQPRAQRGRQLNALRLASGESGSQPVQSQVFQANVNQELQALVNFLQQLVGDGGLLFGELDLGEKLRRLFDGHAGDLADVLAVDPDLLGLDAKPGAAAGRAGRVPAIAAEEDAHVQLVFLALEIIEEAAYAGELAFAFDHHAALLRVKLGPRNIERDVGLLGEALELGEERPVFGLGPGIDGAFVQGLRLVGNHQVEIEVDGVAETLAARAGAVGIVEGEQARLGLLVAQVAVLALEALRKAEALRGLAVARSGLEDDFAGLAIADLDGVHDAGAGVGRNDQAVNQQEDWLAEVDVEQGFRGGEFEDLAVLVEAVEAALAEFEEAGSQVIGEDGSGSLLRRGRDAPATAGGTPALRSGVRFFARRFFVGAGGCGDSALQRE